MGHLRENGFEVEVVEVADVNAVQVQRGVAPQLRGCHTAEVAGYIVEGHVPADALQRFLEEGSDQAGITVPGMPVGPPGMEGPVPVAYDVFTFDSRGNATLYESR